MVKGRLILSGFILIAGLLAVVHLYPSEEKKIKKQFSLLAKWISVEQNENVFTIAHKMKNMGDLFTDKVNLKIPDYHLSGEYSRSDIISYASRARLPFSQFTLQFHDFHMAFPDSETVRVTVTGRITGKWLKEEALEETRELDWILKKVGKEWLFREMEVVEVLKK
jgi:hypothetical protein